MPYDRFHKDRQEADCFNCNTQHCGISTSNQCHGVSFLVYSKHNEMKIFSTLLAHCTANPLVPNTQGQYWRALMTSLLSIWRRFSAYSGGWTEAQFARTQRELYDISPELRYKTYCGEFICQFYYKSVACRRTHNNNSAHSSRSFCFGQFLLIFFREFHLQW